VKQVARRARPVLKRVAWLSCSAALKGKRLDKKSACVSFTVAGPGLTFAQRQSKRRLTSIPKKQLELNIATQELKQNAQLKKIFERNT
jgi:hypothetical protein